MPKMTKSLDEKCLEILSDAGSSELEKSDNMVVDENGLTTDAAVGVDYDMDKVDMVKTGLYGGSLVAKSGDEEEEPAKEEADEAEGEDMDKAYEEMAAEDELLEKAKARQGTPIGGITPSGKYRRTASGYEPVKAQAKAKRDQFQAQYRALTAEWREAIDPDWDAITDEEYEENLKKIEIKMRRHNDQVRESGVGAALFDVKEKKVEKSMDAAEILGEFLEKAKYIRREGGPGNYRYFYADESGKERSTPRRGAQEKQRKIAVEHRGMKISVREGKGGFAATVTNSKGKTLPGATASSAKEAIDKTKKMMDSSATVRRQDPSANAEGRAQAKSAIEAEMAKKNPGGHRKNKDGTYSVPGGTKKKYTKEQVRSRVAEKMAREGKDGDPKTVGLWQEVVELRTRPEDQSPNNYVKENYIDPYLRGEKAEKSLSAESILEDFIKAMPAHSPGMGHAKGASSADGGSVDSTGKTSGSSDSAPGPGQDAKGQITGTSTKHDQLSEDDEKDEAQMKTHKKPIERGGSKVSMMKGSVPSTQRDLVAAETAAVTRALQDPGDVMLKAEKAAPAPAEELEKAVMVRTGYVVHSNASDLAAERLMKSDSMYAYNQPPSLGLPGNSLRTHTQCGTCETVFFKGYTACPNCGEDHGADAPVQRTSEPMRKSDERKSIGGAFQPIANPDVKLPLE